MSLKITVIDEQTGEVETRRVAEGDYAVITAYPCEVKDFHVDIDHELVVVRIKNHNPRSLSDVP